jgi:hypothetical protein
MPSWDTRGMEVILNINSTVAYLSFAEVDVLNAILAA